jgi:hypothetical protein
MIVQTETAVYVINEAEGVLTRYPRENYVGQNAHDVAHLRRDHQIIPYRLHPHFPLRVGEPAVFILNIRNDGVETVRTTTPVVSIDGMDEVVR